MYQGYWSSWESEDFSGLLLWESMWILIILAKFLFLIFLCIENTKLLLFLLFFLQPYDLSFVADIKLPELFLSIAKGKSSLHVNLHYD